jgi:hypothetical protein
MNHRLQAPDSHRLFAAIGWIGFGNHIAANEELQKIAPGTGKAYPRVPLASTSFH